MEVYKFLVRAFLRAFLAKKFGRHLKISYLCIVNEKRRNLRPRGHVFPREIAKWSRIGDK